MEALEMSLVLLQRNQQLLLSLLQQRKRERMRVLRLFILLSVCIRRHSTWTLDRNSYFWQDFVPPMSDSQWRENFRISKKTYQFLCERLCSLDTKFRKAIRKEKRIAIALYALCSSAEYRTVAHLFGVAKSTVCKITLKFCDVFVKACGDIIHLPHTKEEMLNARDAFMNRWCFPQCLGAIDGTHIKVLPPKKHATSYYCYKSFYNIILLAAVDHQYKFMYVNIGSPGRNNDAYVLQNSALYEYLTQNPLLLELSETIKQCSVPLCFLADSAFPLLETLQKPYEEHSSMPDVLRAYNSSLSRGRAVVENAFGRLKARFRILKLLETRIDNAVPVVHAACILNNLCETFQDYFDPAWKKDVTIYKNKTVCVIGNKANRPKEIRDTMAAYFFENE